MKCILSNDAKKDINLVIDYFLQKDETKIANDFVDDFDNVCDMLSRFPEIGCEISEEMSGVSTFIKNTRKWSMKKFKQYIIFYKKEDKNILIIRVINGRRDIPNLFLNWDIE